MKKILRAAFLVLLPINLDAAIIAYSDSTAYHESEHPNGPVYSSILSDKTLYSDEGPPPEGTEGLGGPEYLMGYPASLRRDEGLAGTVDVTSANQGLRFSTDAGNAVNIIPHYFYPSDFSAIGFNVLQTSADWIISFGGLEFSIASPGFYGWRGSVGGMTSVITIRNNSGQIAQSELILEDFEITGIPEPTTYLMCLASMLLLFSRRRC